MSAVRFALAVAFSRDRRALWRQVSLIVGSAIAVVTVLLTVAVPLASSEGYQHGAARSPLYTASTPDGGVGSSPDGAKVEIVSRGTLAAGQQVATVWIRPAAGHESDPDVVPPGLTELPAPGEAVLSPGLIASGVTAEDLGWASSDAGSGANGSIGLDGLMTASEPLIYVRPAEGRSLGEGGAVYYATGFGPEQSEGYPAFAMDPELLTARTMLLGSIGVLLLPGLVVLISSARARSGVRDQRLGLMIAFGVREGVARRILAIEAGSLALVGAAIGAGIYALAALGREVPIPGTSLRLLPGALSVPWFASVMAVLGVAVVAAAVSASGRVITRYGTSSPRRPRAFWAGLLGVCLVGIVASGTSLNPLSLFTPNPEQASLWLFALATLVALVATPLAVPVLCYWVAGLFRESSRPALWAASHRIRHNAVHLARIPAILALLVVISSTATAIWGASVLTQQEGRESAQTTVNLSWRDPQPSDIEQIQAVLDRADLPIVALPTVTQDDSDGPVQDKVLVPDCDLFVDRFAGDAAQLCGEGATQDYANFVLDHTGSELTTGEAEIVDGSCAVRLVSPQAISVTDIQEHLAWLPGLNIDLRPGDVTQPYPTAQWAIAAGVMAMIILGLAAIREVGDLSVEDGARDMSYLRLGLSARTVDVLAWASLLVPLSVSLVASVIVAAVISYSGEMSSITHGDYVRLLLVAGVAFALTVATCATTIIVRHASRSVRGQ